MLRQGSETSQGHQNSSSIQDHLFLLRRTASICGMHTIRHARCGEESNLGTRDAPQAARAAQQGAAPAQRCQSLLPWDLHRPSIQLMYTARKAISHLIEASPRVAEAIWQGAAPAQQGHALPPWHSPQLLPWPSVEVMHKARGQL